MTADWQPPRKALRPAGLEHDGVLFSEAPFDRPTVRHIRVEISRQNSNLTEVKSKMASDAKSAGANAIVQFTYGQVAHPWWKQFLSFKWDSESWFGEGDAIVVAEE